LLAHQEKQRYCLLKFYFRTVAKMAGKRQGPTLRQVAELSGFSQASVSMILNNRMDVSFSDETIRRVKEAAEKLGYARKAEVQGRSIGERLIAVMCPNISNPYYSTLVQAIEQSAWEKDYRILVVNSYRSAEFEARTLELLRSVAISGVIFTMLPQEPLLLERASKVLPCVVIGDKGSSLSIDTVEMDNYSAGVLMARHLLELGHERLAYVSTTLNAGNSLRLKRLQGLEETFRELCPQGRIIVRSREILPPEELGDIHIEHRVGHDLARECLAEGRAKGSDFEGVTAFVGVNDMVAYGVIDALREEGFAVPADYSVSGFDNIFPSGLLPIGLTTVDNYIVDKGHNAFSMLLSRMTGSKGEEGSPEVITRIEYPPRLVVRASTAAAEPKLPAAQARKERRS
jgi:LacI family transcriptional regulator